MTAHTETAIVVVGGGIGGLSAAISLAAANRRVVLFEQQPDVGGKMAHIVDRGFYWDTGPSVVTMRPVFDRIFQRANHRLDDYLDLIPIDPLTRYFYTDGCILDVTRDWPRLAAQIGALHPPDVAGYLDFLAYAAELHRITGPTFIYNRPPTLATLLRVPWRDRFKVDAWSTMQQAINRRVAHPHLRQLLGRFATYVGASPYHAPATLSVIAHVELTGGVWYARGGVYTIAQAMRRLAEDLGVEIHTSTPVEAIELSHGRVVGVRTPRGFQPATTVVANADVTTVYQTLIPPGAIPHRVLQRQQSTPTSCSGFVLLLGVRGTHQQLAHHNVFFSTDYRREFEAIIARGLPPQDPTIYVAITAKSDPSHAPQGAENWFVLVNVPALNAQTDWTSFAAPYRDHILDILARRGYDIRDKVIAEHIRTPLDFAQQTGAWRGALYGISSNSPLHAFRRPHNRSPYIDGLYFAGGTVHPGGGVPMVILSGMAAADMILEAR